MILTDTIAEDGVPEVTKKLHSDHVVGEGVWVTWCYGGGVLLPPSYGTQVEDKDADREEDEDTCDEECSVH